jgi:hypothetical protein
MLEQVDSEHREIYSRRLRYANQQVQRERIEALIGRALPVLPGASSDMNALAQRLVRTRNFWTHLSGSRDDVLEGADLVKAVTRLEFVLKANLLLDVEMPPDVIAQAFLTSRLYQTFVR